MSKFETFKKLARIGAKNPLGVAKAVPYALRYGLSGLRGRLHEEVLFNEAVDVIELAEPSSVDGGVLFSILMPTYEVDVRWLKLAVASIEAQTYSNWELCIVDDASSSAELLSYLDELPSERIHVRKLDENRGISAATNEAAALACGAYLVLMDNDDTIAPNALFELFLRISSTQADILYTDSDVINEAGERVSVLYKPDWSPDLLLSQMYVGHLLAFRKTLFFEVGGFRSEYDGSQDYDLMLRMSERAKGVEHISKVLYSWRALPSSTAENPDSKPYAQLAGLNAVQSFLDRRYDPGYAEAHETDNLFVYDVRYKIAGSPLVSIIIPTKDHGDDLRTSVDSILSLTSYQNYEIIILNNCSELPETKEVLERLSGRDVRVRVIDALFPFNWSKLNNFGVAHASGEVFVFLNNDTEVLSPDWLTRLVEQALRPEVGAVGGLLLYPDGTIQHAGVVVGMGGWSDHVYKGCDPIHHGDPFISPMVTRDVAAVTGACLATSRATYEELGGFDENFIVCGSDVAFCLRALESGLNNVYTPYVRLHHFESKTRDAADIPEVDFKLSDAMYAKYRASGDPYFNRNLDIMSCVPVVLPVKTRLERKILPELNVGIGGIDPLPFERLDGALLRLNLLVPSINQENVFGGIATALKLFCALVERLDCAARIVVTDVETRPEGLGVDFSGYEFVGLGERSSARLQIVDARDRLGGNTLPVFDGEWFIATAWWTAYCLQEEWLRQQRVGWRLNPLLYLIQDFEPGFYPWSSCYMLADSTYKSDVPTIALFNSTELHDFFVEKGYAFSREYVFRPFLNERLAQHLKSLNGRVGKRRQILVYGRPGTPRNAFEVVVEGLRRWVRNHPESSHWNFVSAGEDHPAVYLAKGRYLTSVGKLSLDEYARVLEESYAGISLMVSPHPSYPPLEMAAFGVKVISNSYDNKNLASFSPSLVSLPVLTVGGLEEKLDYICSGYEAETSCANVPSYYLESGDPFPFLGELAQTLRDTLVSQTS